VYDPARDDDPHPHRYSVRLVFIALSTIAFCAAIFPAVSGFQPKVGTSTGDTCFAVRDGWHADRPLTAVQQGGTGACVP